jgi:hypothetical protein
MNLISIIIPLISYLLQVWPRIFKKNFGVDVWTRLLEIDHIRKNNHKIPQQKLAKQFIIEGYFDYPPFFPTLLSFVPKDKLLKIEGFIAPVFDALQVLLVYFVAVFITNNPYLALAAQGIYMLTPMIALENSYLTPRSLGYLNFSLAVTPLLLYYYFQLPVLLFTGLFFSVSIFLTHRFATQSFLFISIFFTFFLKSTLFINVFLGSFIMAIAVTRGYYLRVLKGHLSNIYFWVKNLDYRFAHQIRGLKKENKKTDWVGQIYRFLSMFSPIAVFGLNPWAASGFIALLLTHFGVISLTPILNSFVAWTLFFYFFGVLVLKIKYLMPIGEGQRYMEMATLPSAILSAYLVFELIQIGFKAPIIIGVTLLGIFNFLLVLFIQAKGVINDKNRSLTPALQNVFNYINKQKKTMRIICIPHQNTTLTIYHTSSQVFVNADNPGLLKIMDVYPILKKPLLEIAKEYELSHVLIRTGFVTLKELNLKKKDIEFEQGDIKLVRLS